MPACSLNQSPYHLREPSLNGFSQDDVGHLGSYGLEKLTRPNCNAVKEDDIGQNNQQHQEAEEKSNKQNNVRPWVERRTP
jgi:hypothetical protein